MARCAIYRSDCDMYLEHTNGIWTGNPDTALTGTSGAISDIAEDAFDDGRGDGIPWSIVELDPMAKVQAVLKRDDLCAEAMVAEVGNIVGRAE